ncbi:MAG: FkbM family methyltransferase [Rhodospirillaceae bacterium]|nr:FkbM family methyltransferase [Rhodospirillaceae bacterium]
MMLISGFLDYLTKLAPPRARHRIQLQRLHRWRNLEPEFYILHALVDVGKACIDVGSNEGFYAAEMARWARAVHCIEPNPRLASDLKAKLPRNVIVHDVAASNCVGDAILRIPLDHGVEFHGTATIEPRNALAGAHGLNEVKCRVAPLDQLIDDAIGFLKIDVEGHELAVLEGCQRILSEQRPVILIESEKRHHAQAPENVFRLLGQFGYNGYFVSGGALRSIATFDAARDQRIDDDHADHKSSITAARQKHYVNNFIFMSDNGAVRARIEAAIVEWDKRG